MNHRSKLTAPPYNTSSTPPIDNLNPNLNTHHHPLSQLPTTAQTPHSGVNDRRLHCPHPRNPPPHSNRQDTARALRALPGQKASRATCPFPQGASQPASQRHTHTHTERERERDTERVDRGVREAGIEDYGWVWEWRPRNCGRNMLAARRNP
jgi:hypothetical protein